MSDTTNLKTQARQFRRAWRTRAKISGTSERPRVRLNISNKHMSAQIIDDSSHITLVSATTVGKKSVKGTMSDKAAWLGEELAKSAKSKKISKVVLDRGHKLYHGRVKVFADTARKNGLEF